MEAIMNFLQNTGFALIGQNPLCLVMILVSCVLLYLAIVKRFEPLLLLPIAFGMLLTNLPGAGMYHAEYFANGVIDWAALGTGHGGLIDYLYLGVKLGIYPCLIFVGVGAIGGADGPTAIYTTAALAPELLGPIAVAAYSYMALVPVIQPPIMKLLTSKEERRIKMKQLRPVSKTEKILFPIIVTIFVSLMLPSAAPLVGCLMLGNLMRESGAVDRLSKTVQNELMNIVTIFLGISVGATATAANFLNLQTLEILVMGVCAFALGTAGGVLLAKLMNVFAKEKVNPLIGSAGVSAVPMAARVSQVVGQKEDPSNFLLMHAMGPNVAGVIGSAVAAGVLLSLFG